MTSRRWWLLLLSGLILAACTLPAESLPLPAGATVPLGSPTWTPLPPAAPTATLPPSGEGAAPSEASLAAQPTRAPSSSPTLPAALVASPEPTAGLAPSATPWEPPTNTLSPTPGPAFPPGRPPTATPPWSPTATLVSPPTATAPPPTSEPPTSAPPTASALPTSTPLPPTATPPPPTATPLPPSPTSVPPTPTTAGCAPRGNPGYEDQLLALINQERQNQGLAPLSMNAALREAARAHSRDMACNGFFAHTGSDGSSPADRVARYGYSFSYLGENIYAGNGSYNSPQAAFQAWMNSAGHRENMLSPHFVHVGIGYRYEPNSPYGGYWTADFGSP